jgi:DNA-binding phage protein
MQTKITHHTRINGICKISKKTGYSRYHIQKCVKGERKASKALYATLKRFGLQLNIMEHGEASI